MLGLVVFICSGGLQRKLQVPACLVLLTWQATVYAGAPLPGFEEEALTVPSSINTADDAACLSIGYVVSDYDCTDIPTTNPEIKVSHLTHFGCLAHCWPPLMALLRPLAFE